MRFRVLIPEVHYQTVVVKANSKEEAMSKAKVVTAEQDFLDLEYSHTVEDTSMWKVIEDI